MDCPDAPVCQTCPCAAEDDVCFPGERMVAESGQPSIEDVVRIQKSHGISEHIVWLGEEKFVIAHTDDERQSIKLIDCSLHRWLHELDGPPDVDRLNDFYVAMSYNGTPGDEDYGRDPWEFIPFNPYTGELY